jgi:ketosteroid isomerase-like protein
MGENVTTLEAVYEAINRADLDTILSLQSEDVEWCGPQVFPDIAGPHHGHDGVRAYAARISDAWEDFSIRPERFLELGDRVLVLTRERGRGRASQIEVQSRPTAHLWTLEDGYVVRFEVFWEREEGLRAAGVKLQPARPDQSSPASCRGSRP